MSRLIKRSLSIALGGLLASAAVLSGASPLTEWVASLPMVTNIVSAVNLPTVLVAMAGFPGRNAPSVWTLLAIGSVQWLLYGGVLAWLWSKLAPDKSPRPRPRGSS